MARLKALGMAVEGIVVEGIVAEVMGDTGGADTAVVIMVEHIAEDTMEVIVGDITESLITMEDMEEVEAVDGIHGFRFCITSILLNSITIMMNLQ